LTDDKINKSLYLTNGIVHEGLTSLNSVIPFGHEDHVIVVGYGRNGSQAVDELLSNHIPVVVIENRPKVIQFIQENPKIIYIEGDATDDNVLHKAGIENAKALISALASDADNLFVVITAREINPDLIIISRASAIANDKKLYECQE
jgi:voltage-gated potassium channel